MHHLRVNYGDAAFSFVRSAAVRRSNRNQTLRCYNGPILKRTDSAMTVAIVKSLEEKAWRQFLDENSAANIFHSPEVFALFSRVRGHRPHMWAAVNDDGRVLALLTLVDITLMDGLFSRLTTRSIAYGGLLYAPNAAGEEALLYLLQAYTAQAGPEAVFTELRNLSDLASVQTILQRYGFKFEGHLNYLINLARPSEEIMQNIGKRTRKQIRRGLRQGVVTVTELGQRDQLGGWYDLLQRTYRAAQVPLGDLSLFEAAFDVLHPRNMIKFLVAKLDDTIVSCSAELLFKNSIYGWYSGTDRAYASHIPNELVMWYILEWGAENGYRLYDFGGAGKPDEEYGVRDFKAKFGGDLVNFGRNTYVPRPNLLRVSKIGYEIYQRFL